MLMLASVFQNLAIRKPALDAGVFAYAKAGFGDYVGFNSAFGFWASACVGNTAGATFLLLSCIIYAPGTILYVMARRENDRKIFTLGELVLGVVLWLGAIAGVVGLVTGSITI